MEQGEGRTWKRQRMGAITVKTLTTIFEALYPALASTIVLLFNLVLLISLTILYVTGPIVLSYTTTKHISIAPMPQRLASVPANDIEPTMIRIVKRQQAPVKWMVRRPSLEMRNHERMVPSMPRARETRERLKDWTEGRPACCMKYGLRSLSISLVECTWKSLEGILNFQRRRGLTNSP
jgi:hypothetical protein